MFPLADSNKKQRQASLLVPEHFSGGRVDLEGHMTDAQHTYLTHSSTICTLVMYLPISLYRKLTPFVTTAYNFMHLPHLLNSHLLVHICIIMNPGLKILGILLDAPHHMANRSFKNVYENHTQTHHKILM